MRQPLRKGLLAAGTSVDSASTVFASHLEGGENLTQGVTTFRVTCAFGSAAKLKAFFYDSDDDEVASATLNTDTNLTAGALYGFTHSLPRDYKVNYAPSATTTLRVFWVDEVREGVI